MQDFRLYEGLLHEPGVGYFLFDRHLERLFGSTVHFGFAFDEERVRERLVAFARTFGDEPRKVRLELSRDGSLFLEHVDVRRSDAVVAGLALEPISSGDPFLRHKTSRRAVYERALAGLPGREDAVLWNERDELTETCHANLVLELDGRWLTPRLDAGLLPGTFRAELLDRGEIEEASLTRDDLRRASQRFGVNSVRRWYRLDLTE